MKKLKKYYLFLFLILLAPFCSKEAPTVNPGDYTSGSGGVTPGYYYPTVVAVYPSTVTTPALLPAPVTSQCTIIFNIPVNGADLAGNISITSNIPPSTPLVNGVDYTMTPTSVDTTSAIITFDYGVAANTLLGGDTVNITISAGIRDAANNEPLNNPGVWTFTTGSDPDVTDPTINLGSRIPANGATNISLTAPGIQLTFDEPINPTSINSTTFYLRRIVPGPTTLAPTICGWSPAANPTTATLTPTEPLEPGAQYEVTVTTGMTDLSGNTLSAGTTWTFTTVDGDPAAGVPSITWGPIVVSVTNTTADLSWTTNESTNYTINYGQNSGTGTPIGPVAYYSTIHSYTLNPPLLAGKRYWVDIDYEDYIGNAGTTSSTIEFNTTTNETPVSTDASAGNQSSIKTLPQVLSGTGQFVFWTDSSSGNLYLKGQLYNSTPAAQWGANGINLFAGVSNYTFQHAAEDGTGGVILVASTGNNIYAKNITSAGAFTDWDGGPTSATTTGLIVTANGVGGRAAPVNAGLNRVLYAWRDLASTVNMKINAMAAGAAAVLAEFILDDVTAGTTPFMISDRNNGAIIGYNRTGNNYAHRIDGNGQIYWGTQSSYTGGANLTNGTGTPGFNLGTADLSGGHDWSGLNNEDFRISDSGTGAGPFQIITLDALCSNQTDVVNLINSKLLAAGLNTLFTAYESGNYVGLQTVAIGTTASLYFDNTGITNPDALPTIGLTAGAYSGAGVDWSITNQTVIVNVDGLLGKTITLDARCETLAQVQAEVDGKLTTAYAADPYKMIEAVSAAPNLTLRSVSTGRRRLNITGGTALGTLGMMANTYRNGTALTIGAGSSIVDLQSDNVTGAVFLYKTAASNLIAQRITNAGVLQWGVGYTIIAATATSQEAMACINTPVDAVIVVANIGNNIWARRVGTSAWAGTYISNAVGIQQNPAIFANGANTIITWEDDRFLYSTAYAGLAHNTGWGIFGMKIDASTGVKNAGWYANSGGTDDTNGIALILQNYLLSFPTGGIPNYRIGTYNTNYSILLWEDPRAGNGSDIAFRNLNTFAP